MGCTPPERNSHIPPINSQPSRIQLKSATSIAEMIQN